MGTRKVPKIDAQSPSWDVRGGITDYTITMARCTACHLGSSGKPLEAKMSTNAYRSELIIHWDNNPVPYHGYYLSTTSFSENWENDNAETIQDFEDQLNSLLPRGSRLEVVAAALYLHHGDKIDDDTAIGLLEDENLDAQLLLEFSCDYWSDK